MSGHNPEDFKRVAVPWDPDRCQANDQHGQCKLVAVPGLKYCLSHAGASNSPRQADLANYRTRWKAEIQRKVRENQDIYDLTEEIGILRLTLENLLNRCSDDLDLVMAAGPISDLIVKIERCVTAFHKLRQANGNLLDKTAVLRYVAIVIDILTKYFGDQPEKLEQVAKLLLEASDKATNQANEVNDQ